MGLALGWLAITDAAVAGDADQGDADNQGTESARDKVNTKVTPLELHTVEVVGVTPSSGLGLPLEKVPGNIQSSESEDITAHGALDLSDFMKRAIGSVHVNDVQNNPFQPEVTYRGFSASPLLGSAIGLSVYQDGVRINEPFGDIVNWDLIPKSAIANIELIPGSNPLFGLNALGGSLSVRTKSGFEYPGTRAGFYGGSFGRRSFELEHGGSQGEYDWFVTGNVFHDDGWRPSSSTDIHNAFAKVGWENDTTDLDLSYAFADNTLHGVGPTPESQLNRDWDSVYTIPDETTNDLHFFNLQGNHRLNETWGVSANAYYRSNDVTTFNSNVGNADADCVGFDGFNVASCLDSFGASNPVAPASNQATDIAQYSSGVTLQVSNDNTLFGHENNLVFGASYDFGHTRFKEYEQDAVINTARATVGITPFELATEVVAENEYLGIFAMDTLSVTSWWHVTGSLRWSQATIDIADQTGLEPDLNGHVTFDRINPAAGFTLDPFAALSIAPPMKEFTFYANYNEGFRAPSPIELTCADPASPCSLPNEIVSDPPLDPVIARTIELGLRGEIDRLLHWDIGAYRTELTDDILFISAPIGARNAGYFQNVGNTRRQGFEIGLQGQWQKLGWFANYGFIDATYQSSMVLQNALGPENVTPGNKIPGIPEQTFKFGLEYELRPGLFVGGDLLYASSQYLRGDDINQLAQVPDYAVFNLDARYQFNEHVEIFGMVNNVFDTEYKTFGVINTNFFTGADERFLGPGAPLGIWAGIKLSL